MLLVIANLHVADVSNRWLVRSGLNLFCATTRLTCFLCHLRFYAYESCRNFLLDTSFSLYPINETVYRVGTCLY